MRRGEESLGILVGLHPIAVDAERKIQGPAKGAIRLDDEDGTLG
jgi:hypothetical protein